MEKNDGALRAMLEELDAELERRSIGQPRDLLASGSGMHWMAERAARLGIDAEQTLALVR